ncbi:MAG: glycoside hydrolase family 31 protein [Rikenellaceae bacterium]
MNKILTLLSVFAFTTSVYAQKYTSEIKVLDHEKWWQAEQSKNSVLDLQKTSDSQYLLDSDINTTSLLVSSKGRYVWSEYPFSYTFGDNGALTIASNFAKLEVMTVGKSLREAYLIASYNHFKPSDKMPLDYFITKPQYIVTEKDAEGLTQDNIVAYAKTLIDKGLPVGTLVIDNLWQKHYGNYEIRADIFSDPKAMVDELHKLGFKVVLTVFPFVSPDSPEYRDFAAKGYLVKDDVTNKTKLIEWYSGFSSCLDFTNDDVIAYINDKLSGLKNEYGIDGFVFEDDRYGKVWEMGLKPSSQLLTDENLSWEGLKTVIPNAFESGFASRNYFSAGLATVIKDTIDTDEQRVINQMLTVRVVQMQALMPMMQFSLSSCVTLDEEYLGYCREAIKLREKIAPFILQLAVESSESGAPIIRHLDYEFPGKGFANCEDQFMLGNKYLVVPVVSEDTNRKVRLPNGKWVDDRGVSYKGPLVFNVNVEAGRLLYFEHLSNNKFKLSMKKK